MEQLSLPRLNQSLSYLLADSGPERRALLALLTLVLGWLLALLARRVARSLAVKSGQAVARWGGKSSVDTDLAAFSTTAGRLAYWLVLLFAIMGATEVAQLPVMTAWLGSVASFLPRVGLAIGIVAVGTVAGRLVRHLVGGAATSARLPAANRLAHAAQLGVLVSTWLVAIEQVGVEISFLKNALLIVLGAMLAGTALAFGRGGGQIVANILAAHFVQKTFQVGQRLRFEGIEGRIARFTATAVVVETLEGDWLIPATELNEHRSLLQRPGQPQ